MGTLHDSKLFQEAFTKGEVPSIFQIQFLEKTKEVLKEFVDEIRSIMPKLQEIYDEQDTSSEESGDEQDTSTAEPEGELNSSAFLSNQHPTLTSTPNEEQGDDDTGKVEGHNETATDSGMGTSGIFSETSAQTKTSECQIVGIKIIFTSSKKDEDANTRS